MSAHALPSGPAIRTDGTLKDASKIEWSFDADESVPFPPEAQNLVGASDGGGAAPTPQVSAEGIRRSARAFCPSRRLLEAVEVSSTGPTATRGAHQGAKRKAPHGSMTRRVARKIVVDVDGCSSSEVPDEDNPSTDAAQDSGNDNDAMNPSDLTSDANYDSIKAMTDADHKVRHLCTSVQIFTGYLGSKLQNQKRAYKRHLHYLQTRKVQASSYGPDPQRAQVQSLFVSTLVLSSDFFSLMTCVARRKDPSIKEKACLLTGSRSSLQMHIAR